MTALNVVIRPDGTLQALEPIPDLLHVDQAVLTDLGEHVSVKGPVFTVHTTPPLTYRVIMRHPLVQGVLIAQRETP